MTLIAASKKIAIEDIRVGDKIRIIDVREDVVTEAASYVTGIKYLRGNGGVISTENAPSRNTERTFYLVERPVELPTKPGSVIRYSVDGEVVTWLLMARGYWQGFRGLTLSNEALKDILERPACEFEVL